MIEKKPIQVKDSKKMKKEKKKKAKLEKFEKKVFKFSKSDKKPLTQKLNEKIYYTIETLPGCKKDTKLLFPDKYHPTFVEAAWYDWWEMSNFFSPEYKFSKEKIEKLKDDEKYIMLLPPPNVTGTLHLGHALMCSIQDALARYHRMKGRCVLWVPGCDHAGIATQVVVEKKISREKGLSRHELGRESFIEEVYKWKEEKGNIINEQMRRLAISTDWTRSFFTMDKNRSLAVNKAFVELHKNKRIYRSKKLVNWSCALKSAISDIEVDKVEIKGSTYLKIPNYVDKIEFGVLIYFDYNIVNSDKYITVATTRIETMLGDVAIAVNPYDIRYKDLLGSFVQHPFCDRRLQIIADECVDINFGTGAVKITPAHDPIDFEIGLRHNLTNINIFDDNGYVVNTLGFKNEYLELVGSPRFIARKKIINLLNSLGLLREKKDHNYFVPFCSRSRDVIEPLLKSQWFLDCVDLSNKCIEVVKSGELKIFPKINEKTWFKWMNNIQDWCISRQLWWGHRIPAYYISSPKLPNSNRDDEYYWISAMRIEEALEYAEKRFGIPSSELTIMQDEDVLDTWFSSGILPLSCCNWPERSFDFNNFFPSSVLETGYDILFFWVARMVMLSLELENKLPFHTILLHSIVRDSHGRKMSKSLGNIIDPIDVIQGISLESLHEKLVTYNLDKDELEKARKGQSVDFKDGIPECGTDALRFTLCSYSGAKKDINLDVLRVRGYRTFCNKIWNAVRFCLNNIDENFKIKSFERVSNLSLIDKWILSRLSITSKVFCQSMNENDLAEATSVIYQFWLYNFCDVYIECLKPVLRSNNEESIKTSRDVMFFCIDSALRMLHPFMPYITEELYQRLPFSKNYLDSTPSICVADFPSNLPFYDLLIEKKINVILSTLNLIRSSKDDYFPTKTKIPIYIHLYSEEYLELFQEFKQILRLLCYASDLYIVTDISKIPQGCAITPNSPLCDIYILIKGNIDIESEVNKNSAKLKSIEQYYNNLKEIMSDKDYIKKVPSEVQESNSTKLVNFEVEIRKLQSIIECLSIAK